jgi:glycopeptide antibiotics resistance protein
MIEIHYSTMVILISILWILVRAVVCCKNKKCEWKRELQLILVYICLIVVARFTLFPFSKVDGQVQPLIFDPVRMWNFRINLLPLVYLLDYEALWEAKLNVIGNITMFMPIGIVWPAVFRKLGTHGKVLAAGAGFSLVIEILQLPFFDRVSDVDDLILNSLGFALGYGIYLLVKKVASKK